MLTSRRLTAVLKLRDDRGQALPLFAITFGALLLVLGVVVDGSNGFQNKQAVQNAADAIALAMAGNIAQNGCTPSGPSSDCGGGVYAGYNHANGATGDSSASTGLSSCSSSNPPPNPCFVYPYVDSHGRSHSDEVQVDVTRRSSNFFGGLFGLSTFTESAKAVGAVAAGGTPPSISFAALDSSAACDAHTLLVKSGGHLTVDSGIYDLSCSGGDSFDIFGPGGCQTTSCGGSITAPTISLAAGWEDHNYSQVFAGTGTIASETLCTLARNGGGQQATSTTVEPQPGCPLVGQTPATDPFVSQPLAPSPGTPQCPSTQTTTAPYVPNNVTLNANATGSSGPAGFAPNVVTLNASAEQNADGSYVDEAAYNSNVTLSANASASSSTSGYTPNAVTVNGGSVSNNGTINDLITYNPNVTLNANALGAPASAPYTPNNVTINGATVNNNGTFNDLITYNPNVTLNANALGAPTSAAYTPNNVTINGATVNNNGTFNDLITYNPNVTLNAAALSGPTPSAYSPNVTVSSAISNGPSAAPYTPAVTLNAAAVGAPTPASYTPQIVTLSGAIDASQTSITVTNTSPNKEVANGDVILIDSEEMQITNVPGGPGGCPCTITVTRGYASTTAASHNSGVQAYKEGGDTSLAIKWTGGATPVATNDVIEIDSEQMLVTNVGACGASPCTITVQRAYNGTAEAAHSSAAPVLEVTPDTQITIKWTGGPTPVAVNDVILIDGEQMLVTNVPGGGGGCGASPCTITVQRHYNGTTEAAHSVGATVFEEGGDTSIVVTNTGGGSSVHNGDVIQVDSEEMKVTAVTGGPGPWTLTVTRAYNGTTEAAHSSGATVYDVVADTTLQVTNVGTTAEVANGDVILVDGEQMLVTAVNPGATHIWNLTVTRAYGGTSEAVHSAGATVKKVTPDTSIVVTNTGGTSSVHSGDVIQVDNEQMKVTAVSGGVGPWTLTVTRAYNGTTEAAHSSGATVYDVVADTTLQVLQAAGGAQEVAVGDIIQVDTEQMLVTAAVSGGTNLYNLTVTRAYGGTTEATHSPGATVSHVQSDGQLHVTDAGGALAVDVGDTIQVDGEQMLVNTIVGAGPWTLNVSRAQNGTTENTHSTGATVYEVVPDTTLQVLQAAGGAQEVAVGDVIEVDSEQMLVTAVASGGTNIYDLTVQRAFNASSEASHNGGAVVSELPDETIQVTNAGAQEVQAGDWIQIDSEQMLVQYVLPAGGQVWNLVVTRGYFGTSETTHNKPATVSLVSTTTIGSAASPSPCEISTGSVTLQPGTYYGGICIGAATGSTCSNSAATNCSAYGGTTQTTVAYSPNVETLSANVGASDTTVTVTNTGSSGEIAAQDVIAIDNEEMYVSAIQSSSGATQTLDVTREWDGTEAVTHTSGTTVSKVVTTPNGTAFNPGEKLTAGITTDTQFDVTQASGSGSLAVGQVIQIDSEAMKITAVVADGTTKQKITVTRAWYNTTQASHSANAVVSLVTGAGTASPPVVTLAPGVYIMAGGGFSVCGAAQLVAPHVMIYNTNDSSGGVTTGNGALGQVDLNTSGSVKLGPQNTGTYAGMTIFQDRSLTLFPGDACDPKSNKPNEWDIALQSMGSAGPLTGALGSISGTVYAPNLHSDFGDSVSGTANLAILTSCIYINGANSTFTFNSGGGKLFGLSATLSG